MPGRLHAGVDLGGTKIETVILGPKGVLGSARVPTPQDGATKVIGAIVGSIATALEAAKATRADLAAVGIGSPGAIDEAKGTVSAANNVPGFQGTVALGPAVSKQLGGTRVVLDNDVRVAVIGELRQGAGKPYKNFLGAFVGTGVGGAVVIDGALIEGRGAAGEIGHTVVQDEGWRCNCGRRGCLEAYAGRAEMERRARKWAAKGRKTKLFKIMESRAKTRLTSGVFAEALAKEDHVAQVLIGEATWALGLALASAQNLLDLEAIIVGGGLGTRLGQPFADSIARSMQPHLFRPDAAPAVLTAALGDLGGAIGAALKASPNAGG